MIRTASSPLAWGTALGAAVLVAGLTQGPVAAQGRPAPPPPTNLQVLPKDISRPDLNSTMRGFTTALGVECSYCHVNEGRGGRNDMASDEKPTKNEARVMMRMMAQVNETLAANLGKPAADIEQVQCMTCHRGSAVPKLTPPAPAAPPAH
jgi:Photosynthetic reaction centre cytochrome C subunit